MKKQQIIDKAYESVNEAYWLLWDIRTNKKYPESLRDRVKEIQFNLNEELDRIIDLARIK